MATASLSITRKIGNAVKKAAKKKGAGAWYGPHMAAASRAIADRIPLVDLVLEIRDARIPLSSEFEQLKDCPFSTKRITVLNKIDLAKRSQLKDWMTYFNQQNCLSFGVNSHNKDSVKEFLNFLQARLRELKKTDNSSHTMTVMLVGIPNVGKSALANSLHQIGRISAEERGKLRHATVSPQPGETKDIYSFKIASHPNVYVLDTPSILPPEILDIEICSRLALTGAIRDGLVGEKELAQYFLAILDSSDEYKKWAKFSTCENDGLFLEHKEKHPSGSKSDMKRKRQYATDHTQDFMVQKVRQTLFDTISCFDGNLENEEDLVKLIEAQFTALGEAFQIPVDISEDVESKVSSKLLNLYRTGRLGHYTLDPVPKNTRKDRVVIESPVKPGGIVVESLDQSLHQNQMVQKRAC